MPPVINSHGRGHTQTQTHTHTNDPHRTNFKKPGAADQRAPGLITIVSFSIVYIRNHMEAFESLPQVY